MAKLDVTTALASFLVEAALRVYDKTTDRCTKIRRLGITFEDVCDEGCEGYNLFTNFDAVERERIVQQTVLDIRQRYGKNAVLRGINYMPEGTQREQGRFIGGHRAGYVTRAERAKIFSPFDAMKGLQEALRDREERHLRVERHDISEEQAEHNSRIFLKLRRGMKVEIDCYCAFHDVTKCGRITDVSCTFRWLKLDGEQIYFEDIYSIEITDLG